MEIKRTIRKKLTAWKQAPDRKPLILQGARQVGKTWLLTHFGASENRLFMEFKGALSENFILQHLIANFEGTPLYWTSGSQAEVDFLIQVKNGIIPIEVKSDESIRSKSLAVYNDLYQPPVRIRYSLKNLKKDGGLLNIPLFMVDHTEKLLRLS